MMQALRRYYRGATLAAVEEVQTGRRLNYHFDHQGTVQCLTDDTGAVTDRFASDAWGVPVKRTGASLNRQWYVGNLGYYRQVDQALDYVRARYATVALARWTSRDLLPSSPAYYVLASNNPSHCQDPSGWLPIIIAGPLPGNATAQQECAAAPPRTNALTGCNFDTGRPYTVLCNHNECTVDCLMQHERTHRVQFLLCCGRATVCMNLAGTNAKSVAECVSQYTKWHQANLERVECEAYTKALACAEDLLFRDFLENPCGGICTLTIRNFRDNEQRGVNKYCPGNNLVDCPFDEKGRVVKPLK